MASHQHEELEVSPSCTSANSVVLETGETGLVLTLIYTHEPQGFHREESLPDCGSGTFSEKKAEIETGICSFTHCKEQASLPSPLLDMRKVGCCAKWNKLEMKMWTEENGCGSNRKGLRGGENGVILVKGNNFQLEDK